MWKQAKVAPLLKKGDLLIPKNYRPVALLPILSKILEKVVFQQIVEYLDSNKLLSPLHHGCRSVHNTATALIQMYDQWVEEVEAGQMVGVMMIDLSAAFDMVDYSLLLDKLALFELEAEVTQWLQSYLTGRSQSVLVDGCLSPPLNIEFGVPQGSILGPLMYIIFTNDIPDLVHDHAISYDMPEPHCSGCGSTVCYVDDATFSVSHSDPAILSQKLTNQYKRIEEYMAANKLVINGDKTHLVVMGSKAHTAKRQDVRLQAGDHNILPSSTEKLLGGIISQDLKWKQHLLDSDQSLVCQLTSRINGLSLISSSSTFATKLMVANGIILSKLCYLIQLWGGTEAYLLKSLQVLQNRAARIVIGCSWFTPTRTLLKKCNWLSVKQMIFYQSVILTHKIVKNGSPFYLAQKMSTTHAYRTRQATAGGIRYGELFASTQSRTQDSFCYRTAGQYNSIPAEIRSITYFPKFKTKLKQWVGSNVPID